MSVNPFHNYDIENWGHDLLAAIIGGGSSAAYGALAVTVVDPKDFNPQTAKFYQVAGLMFIFGAATHLFAYLKDHPLPAKLVSERKQQSIEVSHIPLQGTGDGTVGNEATLKKTVTTKTEEKVEIAPVETPKTSG